MPRTDDHGLPVGDEVPGWSPRERPRPTLLEGRYVRLEPVSADHAEPLHASVCGPEDAPLWTYRTTGPPTDVAETARMVAAHAGDADTLTWAIVPEGREAEGLASFMRIEPDHGQVEVAGVLLARTLQRTRAATEAIHLLLRYAFEDLGYRRVEWKCDSLNEPSRRAAHRFGFTYEGRFRQHLVVKGRNRDTDWFSITDAEWPEVRAAHEAWLDPSNFEDDGTQRTPLSRRPGPPPGP